MNHDWTPIEWCEEFSADKASDLGVWTIGALGFQIRRACIVMGSVAKVDEMEVFQVDVEMHVGEYVR